jgi:hypothetical protein
VGDGVDARCVDPVAPGQPFGGDGAHHDEPIGGTAETLDDPLLRTRSILWALGQAFDAAALRVSPAFVFIGRDKRGDAIQHGIASAAFAAGQPIAVAV